MRRTIAAVLTIAGWAGSSAHPDAFRPADPRPGLYDLAGDSAAPSVLETLATVKDWWRSSLQPHSGHQQHLSFLRLPSGRLKAVDDESWQPCLQGTEKIPEPRSRVEEAPIWGSVMLLHREYVTVRTRRTHYDGIPKASLCLGYGIPLAGLRLYFISGKPSSPEELLLEFEVDPFLNERGMLKVRRVSGPRWSTFQATFRSTHSNGRAAQPAEVTFEAPSGTLPKLRLYGPIGEDCLPMLEGRIPVAFDDDRTLHQCHWPW